MPDCVVEIMVNKVLRATAIIPSGELDKMLRNGVDPLPITLRAIADSLEAEVPVYLGVPQ